MRSRYPVVNAINEALSRVPPDAVHIDVNLSWPYHVRLLAIKGLNTDATQVHSWGPAYANRPLKIYGSHDLFFIQHRSHVRVLRSDQSMTMIQIPDLGGDE